MIPVISAILAELALMSVIVSTIRPTAELPRCATSDALLARPLACCALSAFRRTVEVSCSMLDAVSCNDAACCSVRDDRSWLPDAISPAPVATLPDAVRTSEIRRIRFACMSRIEASTLPAGAAPVVASAPRLPAAIWPAISLSTAGSVPSERSRPRVMKRPESAAAAAAAMQIAISIRRREV